MTALAIASPVLEIILDDLSFQVQEPLRVIQYEALDVTPPVQVGETREMTSFPFPHGYMQYKLQKSAHLGTVWTNQTPILRADYSVLPRRVQDAVDWYIKGLHAGFDADQYVFYWISLEILRGLSDTSIDEPTRLRCGHEIARCPECGKDTAQIRQAATTYAFLGNLNVDDATARRLWAMRHLVHGAKSFGQDQMTDLAELVQLLRAAVVKALKRQLGYADDEAPIVVANQPAVGSTVGLGGSRAIEPSDLADC